jgi:PKD repeat protein
MRRDRRARSGLLLCCLVIALLAVAVGVAAGGADGPVHSVQNETDSQPPVLAGGERLDDTTIELTFTDDTGVDVDSISAEQFLLSAGELAGISTRANGPDAIVELSLAEPVDAPAVTVGLRDGSQIQDVDGNTLNTTDFVGVTVDGMDAVPPGLRRLEVPDRVSETAELQVVFEEAVDAFRVTISGPRETTLDREDFDRVGEGQYALSYEPPVDGTYTVELHNATDTAGNTATFGRAASMEVRSADVRAVAGVDFSASEGLTLTFDASQSTEAATAYLWDFGDGETATGERVTHEFRPGDYTVHLEVIDEFGNTGRDEVVLSLTGNTTAVAPGTGAGDRPVVQIDRSGTPRPLRTHVSIAGVTAGESIDVGGDGLTDQPLVATGVFSLDRMRLTPAGERPIGIGLTAAGRESSLAADARGGTDGEPIGGFVARPTVPDDGFSAITVRFTVSSDELRRLGTSAGSVGLYRETDGSWDPLDTTLRSLTEAGAVFESELPGFSRFAVLATPPETDENGGGGNDADENSGSNGGGTDDTTDGSSGDAEGSNADGEAGSDADSEAGSDDGTGAVGETNSTGTGQESAGSDQFRVTNVTLGATSIEPGEPVEVRASVVNQGEEPGDYVAALERNGTVLQTKEVVRIPPSGEDLPIRFTQRINETGTVQLSINGTAAPELSVSEGGGGGPFGIFGILGILPVPIGLLRTGLLYVVGPILVIYLVLKVIARRR